jgi:hypothetical protein
MSRSKLILIVISINVFVLNIAVGYLGYLKIIKEEDSQAPIQRSYLIEKDSSEEDVQLAQGICLEECQALIEEKIESISSSTPKPASTVSPVLVTKEKIKRTYYIPVPGSGNTSNNDWTDLSGTDFYFDPGEYKGIVEARFETNIKLLNGNGRTWVRLFDVTHSIGVINSEAHTDSQTTDNVTSGEINFWSGRNLYRVQAKSLTADTAIYEGGRIKVVTEN